MTSLSEQVVVAVSFEAAFALLVEYSLKATLLLGVACLAGAMCRRCSAALQHAIWAASVTAVLALPVLAYCLPSWNAIPAGAASRDSEESTAASLPASHPSRGDLEPARSTSLRVRRGADIPNDGAIEPPRSEFRPTTAASDRPLNSADRSTFAASTPDLSRWAVITWFAVTVLLAFRLVVSWLRLRQLTRRCRPVTGGPILTEFTAICDDFRLRRRVSCCVAPIASVPLATGILNPHIILPPASREWSREQLRSVLMHEVAHIRRHDCLTQLVANLTAALHWFNPFVWLAAWRMQVERESACDDDVLRQGVPPARYAEQLFSVATGLEYRRVLAATSVAMARPSRLESRLHSIASKNRRRQPVNMRQRIAIVGAMLLVGGSTAMLRGQNEPADQTIERPDRSLETNENSDTRLSFEPSETVDLYGDALPKGAVARLGTMRLRLTGWDKSLEFTSDNRTLLTATADKSPIRLWSARTGRPKGEIVTAPFSTREMRILPDGKTVITYGFHYPPAPAEHHPVHALQTFDLQTGQLVSMVDPHVEHDVRGFELSPDGKALVLGELRSVRVLDARTGEEILRNDFREVISAVAIAPEGDLLAVATDDSLFLWEWLEGRMPEKIASISSILQRNAIAFAPDGAILATAIDSEPDGSEPEVLLWDIATKSVRLRLRDESSKNMRIRRLEFTPDGTALLAANSAPLPTNEPGVLMWNTATGQLIRRHTLRDAPWTIDVSPDGRLVAAVGNSACTVWEVETGNEVSADLIGHTEPISAVAFTPDDRQVVTGDYVGTVRLWDAQSGNQLRMWKQGTWVKGLAVSHDGQWIASSAEDLCVWNAETGDLKYRLAGHGRGERKALGYSPDGQRLISWGDDNLLRTWDVETGTALSEYPVRTAAPVANRRAKLDRANLEAFSPTSNSKRLCVVSATNLYVFDTASGDKLADFPIPGGSHGREIQLSPDGTKMIALTAKDHEALDQLTAELVDVSSRKILWKRPLPRGMSGPAGFSPDGTMVGATVRAENGAIVVWDVATGTERVRIEGIPEVAWGGRGKKLAISSDNSRLAVAMMNTTTLIWDISQTK